MFVCGNGDISFCEPWLTREILEAIEKHNVRCPYKTYYFQSKRPEYFRQFEERLPQNVILVTTLETNRDAGYELVSKAPPPSERYRQFLALDYPRKVVTIEPVMDFDVDVFAEWIASIGPEYVWLGYNSRPREVRLPEPDEGKLRALVERLTAVGIEIRRKDLRGQVVGLHGASCTDACAGPQKPNV